LTFVKELIMCFKIPADSMKDVRKQAVSSDRAAESARHEQPDSIPAGLSITGSGVIAMFRRLLASFNKKAPGPAQHLEVARRMTDERREVEKVH
jgi:hypothetical protein